jgi:hypothetical protein
MTAFDMWVRRTPSGKIFSMSRLRRPIRYPPSGPPSRREKTCVRRSSLWPRPGIANHESGESLGMPDSNSESDWSAPVLHHHRDCSQVEMADEALDNLCVLGWGKPISRRRYRQPEAGVIDCDAAEVASQTFDDFSIQK